MFDDKIPTKCAHNECTLPADESISCVLYAKTHVFCSHRHEQQWLAQERHKIARRAAERAAEVRSFNGA